MRFLLIVHGFRSAILSSDGGLSRLTHLLQFFFIIHGLGRSERDAEPPQSTLVTFTEAATDSSDCAVHFLSRAPLVTSKTGLRAEAEAEAGSRPGGSRVGVDRSVVADAVGHRVLSDMVQVCLPTRSRWFLLFCNFFFWGGGFVGIFFSRFFSSCCNTSTPTPNSLSLLFV